MSAGSFDESSNLVLDLPSPQSTEKDDVFLKLESTEHSKPTPLSSAGSSPASSKSSTPKKSKALKGIGFLIKAREGAHKRAKSPSKGSSKSPAKSPSKSPTKSPSREILTKELSWEGSGDESSTGGKSEQWQAFLQMQDRIKQNVLKTQSSLGKLAAGRISPSGRISPAKGERLKEQQPWTDFDDSEPLDTGDDGGELMSSQANGNGNDNDLSALISLPTKDLPHLKVTPVGSPSLAPIFPSVPHNSRRSSKEEENPLDAFAFENPAPMMDKGDQEVEDLLGLTVDDNGTSGMVQQPSKQIINEDLLGLDDFLSEPVSSHRLQPTPTSGVIQNDWWAQGSSSIQSSAQSSLCSSPVAFDSDFLGEQNSTAVSDLARSLVDDFLQWGAETAKMETKPSANPFADSVSHEKPVQGSGFDSLDPFGSGTASKSDADPFGTSSAHKPAHDIFGVGDTSARPGKRNSDPFGMSESGGGGESDPFGLSGKETTTRSGSSDNNPFGGSRRSSEDPFGTSAKSDPLGDIWGSDSGSKVSTSASEVPMDSGDSAPPPPPADDQPQAAPDSGMAAFDINGNAQDVPAPAKNPFLDDSTPQQAQAQAMDFEDEDDFFSKAAPVRSGATTDDIWGSGGGAGETAQVANPFQDDPFTADSIPTAPEPSSDGKDLRPINPFLTASFENIAAEAKKKNPFYNTDLGDGVSGTGGVDLLFGSSAPSESAGGVSGDDFDPFAAKEEKMEENARTGLFASRETKQLRGSTYDNLEQESPTGFTLDIKPVSSQTEASGPPPALPPPPKPPKSPQMPQRENPFDRDSPPEENFAKFQVIEEEIKREALRDRVMSESSEASTPEEEKVAGPLEEFITPFEGEGWALMLRQPTKKKLGGNRFWKSVYVQLVKQNDGSTLKIYNKPGDNDAVQELPLQPCYSHSEIALQQYDQYGKIFTLKIQYVFYRERVGIRPERITPSFVRKPKPTMILDHAPQVSELFKFGSLDRSVLETFKAELDDAFMQLIAHREKTLTYQKDEIQGEVHEEYRCKVDKLGHILAQKVRVRVFVLAFLTGMPMCELGMNDRRRKGREVVGRHDIIPVKTEDWIRIEDPIFHCSVDKEEFEKTNTIRFQPLDACQFEIMRFRVRPKQNRELPLQLRVQQTCKGRHFEIRCDMLVTGYHANSKKHGQFPCEDIEVRFPLPEPWIYLFRYERRFGYGSFKSQSRKPGKIKGLERLTQMAQGLMNPTLMEASVGIAKYEHVYRSVVWRVSRLPERNEGAYKNHLFMLRLDLGPHDEIPESFAQKAYVHFTMPSTTVAKTMIRSISVTNPNPPEKWVRCMGKYNYEVDIDTHIETESDNESKSE